MLRILILGFSVLFLCACSATGPKYSEHQSTVNPPGEGESRLVFYRESRFMSGGVDAVISINGSKVGECGNGAYFYTDVPSGNTEISTVTKGAPGEHKIERTLEVGKQYYFEVLVNDAYVHSGAFAGLIGQSIYISNNENSCGWIFSDKSKEEALSQITDNTYSIDGE